MTSKLIIDYEKCVGCESCEQACSAKKTGTINPVLSRIGVVRRELGVRNAPIVCQQCESAPCMAICPVKAISQDEKLGRMVVNLDICIGCRMCIAICPFGCMQFDEISRKVFKCDLCDGDPACVKFCQHEALLYLDATQQSTLKQTATAEKISGIMHNIASAMASVK
jgi:carbon-monoxide dehydrogenase iron sulfur subunit